MAIIIRKNKATEAVAQPMTLSRVMSFTRVFNPTDSIKPLIEIKIGIASSIKLSETINWWIY